MSISYNPSMVWPFVLGYVVLPALIGISFVFAMDGATRFVCMVCRAIFVALICAMIYCLIPVVPVLAIPALRHFGLEYGGILAIVVTIVVGLLSTAAALFVFGGFSMLLTHDSIMRMRYRT